MYVQDISPWMKGLVIKKIITMTVNNNTNINVRLLGLTLTLTLNLAWGVFGVCVVDG